MRQHFVPDLVQINLCRPKAQRRAVFAAIFLAFHAQHALVPRRGHGDVFAHHHHMVDPVHRKLHQVNPAKKSLPLSSTTMKAGNFSTSIFQTASIPNSGYSKTSTFRMLFCASTAAGPPMLPR